MARQKPSALSSPLRSSKILCSVLPLRGAVEGTRSATWTRGAPEPEASFVVFGLRIERSRFGKRSGVLFAE